MMSSVDKPSAPLPEALLSEAEKKERRQEIINANLLLFEKALSSSLQDASIGGNAGIKKVLDRQMNCLGANFLFEKSGQAICFENCQNIDAKKMVNNYSGIWRVGADQLGRADRLQGDYIVDEYYRSCPAEAEALMRETAKTWNLTQCNNWEELLFAVFLNGDFQGSRGAEYTAETVSDLIKTIREGHVELLRLVPRTYGLRSVVERIIKKSETEN